MGAAASAEASAGLEGASRIDIKAINAMAKQAKKGTALVPSASAQKNTPEESERAQR
jgi:hypothetical protein